MNIKNFTNEGLFGTSSTAGTPTTPTANTPAQSYEFRLMEYGQLTAGGSIGVNNYGCGNMGNQFRPLKEVDKYGRVNPFQAPNRGVIPAVSAGSVTITPATVPGNNGGTIAAGTKVRNILISLSGKDSIIGRGIAVYNKTPISSTNSTLRGTRPVGCCVVGLDVPPTVNVNHHHHYGYGYGGYGHGYSSPSYSSGHSHSHSAPSHGHGYGSGHGYTTAASKSGSSYFSNRAYQPASRYSSHRY